MKTVKDIAEIDSFDEEESRFKKTKFKNKEYSNPKAEKKAIRKQRKAKQKMREDAYKMMNGELDVQW